MAKIITRWSRQDNRNPEHRKRTCKEGKKGSGN